MKNKLLLCQTITDTITDVVYDMVENSEFFMPHAYLTSPWGYAPRLNFAAMFGVRNLEWWRQFDNMFSQFDIVHERDRRTDKLAGA